MTINFSDIFSKPSGKKNLDEMLASLPEPPEELKEMFKKIEESLTASLTGQKCELCGKAHPNAVTAADIALVGKPQFTASDGIVGEYEYKPKSMAAIQFLPSNVPDVMQLLFENGVPFAYAETPAGEDRILLLSPDSEVNLPTDELRYGKWAVVTGSKSDGTLGFSACFDDEFRSTFQAKAAPGGLDGPDGDALLQEAEQEAVSAFGSGFGEDDDDE